MSKKTTKVISSEAADMLSQPAIAPEGSKVEAPVTFTAWFQMKIGKGHKALRTHHREAVEAFFKAKGLKDSEQAKVFDEMLKVYGI